MASAVASLGIVLDHADMIEHERNRAGLGQIAAVLRENCADLARGAVAIVGQRLHDHRHAARPVAFVADFIVVLGVGALRSS